MPSPSDIHLTEERIRAVVSGTQGFSSKLRGATRRHAKFSITPEMLASAAASGTNLLGALSGQFDAAAGSGAGRHVSDSTRLIELLAHLADGTIDEAIAREEGRAAHTPPFGGPEMQAQMRAAGERRIAELRAIPQSEVDAVLACLDEIEKLYPREVERIRFRHDPEVRERRLGAAAALRTGDPTRPPLTGGRVRRVAEVLRQLLPLPQKAQVMFENTDVLTGKPAVELLGASVVKKLAKLGEDPEAYARDAWWTRHIAMLLSRGESVDEKLAELQQLVDPTAWLNPYDAPARSKRRAGAWAAAMSGPYEILRRITPDEEDAVRRLLPELMPVFEEARH